MAPLHSESSSLSQTDKALHSPTSGLSLSLLLSWLLPKWPSTGASDILSELSQGLCSRCSYALHPHILCPLVYINQLDIELSRR